MKTLVFYIPSIEQGGVEKNFFQLINQLKKRKNFIFKIITYKKIKYLRSTKNLKIIYLSKSNFIKNRLIKFILCFIILLKEITFKKCIIIAYQSNILAIIASKITGNKIIIRFNTSINKYIKNLFKKYFFLFFYKLADKIIVNSFEFKKQLKTKLNLDSIVILNILNVKKTIKLSNIKFNFPFFKNFRKLKIINIGRLTDQKDHFTLLKSFKSLIEKRDAKLLIIGEGKNKKKIEGFISSNSLKKKVKLISFRKNPFKYIKNSDLFVLTSVYEGFPNVLLESACLKKPIISSNCKTGPKEFLLNRKGGYLFKTKDTKTLTKILLNFKLNSKSVKSKINFSFNQLKKYSLHEHEKKFLKTTKNLIN